MSIFWNDGTALYHYGIPGMRWGARKWQNKDGSLTPAGYVHYGYGLGDYQHDTAHYIKDGSVRVDPSSTPVVSRVSRTGSISRGKYIPRTTVKTTAKYTNSGSISKTKEIPISKVKNTSTVTKLRNSGSISKTKEIPISKVKNTSTVTKLTNSGSISKTKEIPISKVKNTSTVTKLTNSGSVSTSSKKKRKQITDINSNLVDGTVASTHMKDLGLKYVTKYYNTKVLQYEDNKYQNESAFEDRRRAGKKK